MLPIEFLAKPVTAPFHDGEVEIPVLAQRLPPILHEFPKVIAPWL
jgi:hypothetical protein